jgi:2-polyprenyl-3-methyl-5-hydroxy-6-metoxy-1,4-benzoquinol methylase
MEPALPDPSNGYEACAGEFMARRARSTVGVAIVRAWARTLPPGAAILDLGCGGGVPISRTLVDDGFKLWGVDASARMVAAFRQCFPGVPVANEAAEASGFFGRRFDAVIAWGLIFLLPAEAQAPLIGRIGAALRPGGRCLFTAPTEAASWPDALTGLSSVSLGDETYRSALADSGLELLGEFRDEGDNHYYDAVKR